MKSVWKTYVLCLLITVGGAEGETTTEKTEEQVIGKPEMRRDYFMTPFFDDPIFHMGYLQSPWGHLSRLDRVLFDLGKQLSIWDRDFKGLANLFTCHGLVDRADLFPSIESQLDEQSGKYIVNIPLGKNLSSEDVKVSMKDHIMTVEAKKEHKSEDGKSRTYQEFMRKFTLPERVDTSQVKSMLTPEGFLKIEAPVPKGELPEPEKPKEIPVIHA